MNAATYRGSLAQLNEIISRENDECAQWVKDKNITRSLNGSRAACSDAINAYFGPLKSQLEANEAAQEAQVKAQFLNTSGSLPKLIIIVALLILLILIF